MSLSRWGIVVTSDLSNVQGTIIDFQLSICTFFWHSDYFPFSAAYFKLLINGKWEISFPTFSKLYKISAHWFKYRDTWISFFDLLNKLSLWTKIAFHYITIQNEGQILKYFRLQNAFLFSVYFTQATAEGACDSRDQSW